MFYIYILFSTKSQNYYVGYTSDVQRRLTEHNDPTRVKKYSTKHIPWNLKLSFEVTENRGDAMRVERFIKNQKNRKFIEKLISEVENPAYFISLIKSVLNK